MQESLCSWQDHFLKQKDDKKFSSHFAILSLLNTEHSATLVQKFKLRNISMIKKNMYTWDEGNVVDHVTYDESDALLFQNLMEEMLIYHCVDDRH